MQLVGIGFNPSFWRFLLPRLEKHTGHGPLVGTLLDPSYLQPDRLVSTCAHLQDLQPVFTFFTPHGFREHRDCIFFLSQMQARLREVPLALVLENIQEAREDHNDDLQVEGIVVNQYQPRARLPQELVASLEEEGLPILANKLSSSVVMRESHEKATPLVNMQPRHKLTDEYRALFREISAG